ncbi:hypothetical protein VP01_2643g4 [Puccinia sorghi]|uniref:Uncharacterized protein n=1 Tax=Puccinia sorghi TaxID=27349 RepID=A0A0L6V633_9BASI|nr:hypothetical protein VP01_2643g4 [Puccinia sorghi]
MANNLRARGRNFYVSPETVDNAPSLIKSSSPEATTIVGRQTNPTAVKNIKEDFTPPENKRRSLLSARRGCFGKVGSGLLLASDVLAKKGNKMQRFDQLSTREKLKWLARKTKNGKKHAVSFAAKTVILPVKAVAFLGKRTFRVAMVVLRGTGRAITKTGKLIGKGVLIAGYLVYKAGSGTLKFVGRVALRSWKYFGKELAATGRGLQKAGNAMQAQTAARLRKKIKTPPTEEPAPQIKPGIDHT